MKPKIIIALAGCILMLAISCTKENNSPSLAHASAAEKLSVPDAFYIGQHYGGGIIFYIDSTGSHGFIAAPEDQGVTGYGSDVIRTGARARAIGKGFDNTAKIINAYGRPGTYAALLCARYKGGGYSGWFLPSLQELGELYTQRSIVGGFTTGSYWSSTETSWDWAAAWIQYFSDETTQTPSSKWNLYAVRAIRAF